MYLPRFNAMDDATARQLVYDVGSAELVTIGSDGFPTATLLPVMWEGDRVIAHMARANPHWRSIDDGSPVLLICTGPQAYVSPSWYPTKAEHGRVVPTWNYSSVHLSGRIRVHHDVEWLRGAVTELVDRHEGSQAEPWAVRDAPTDYVDKMLTAIVGLEITVERVEAKAKWSQNRPEADRLGVLRGLQDGGATDAARAMDALLHDTPT